MMKNNQIKCVKVCYNSGGVRLNCGLWAADYIIIIKNESNNSK